MSVQSEIDRIKANVADAYAAVTEKGGVVPDVQNSDNLPGAIRSIGPQYKYLVADGLNCDSVCRAAIFENYEDPVNTHEQLRLDFWLEDSSGTGGLYTCAFVDIQEGESVYAGTLSLAASVDIHIDIDAQGKVLVLGLEDQGNHFAHPPIRLTVGYLPAEQLGEMQWLKPVRVYLDGAAEVDGDGTEGSPCSNLASAIELAGKYGIILVTNTVTLDGIAEYDLMGITIMPAPWVSLNTMFLVNGDITIDGGTISGKYIEGEIV